MRRAPSAPTNAAEAREHLSALRGLAEKTVNQVRDLALLLRPSMLDDFGLVPALNWHAREMTKRTGLNVVLSADDEADDLPDEHKTCIYRLVQEAINNSARHASARTVEVEVKREADRVRFSVRDDGTGFDPRFVRGLGLLGMEERVRQARRQDRGRFPARTRHRHSRRPAGGGTGADQRTKCPFAYCWLTITRWCGMDCARCSSVRPI